MMIVGLDVHKKVCYGTVMDEKGTVLKQAKFTNDHEARVVMEAGYCWQPLYDRLEEAGHDVRLAHPKKVKALTKKTDSPDSDPGPPAQGTRPISKAAKHILLPLCADARCEVVYQRSLG